LVFLYAAYPLPVSLPHCSLSEDSPRTASQNVPLRGFCPSPFLAFFERFFPCGTQYSSTLAGLIFSPLFSLLNGLSFFPRVAVQFCVIPFVSGCDGQNPPRVGFLIPPLNCRGMSPPFFPFLRSLPLLQTGHTRLSFAPFPLTV